MKRLIAFALILTLAAACLPVLAEQTEAPAEAAARFVRISVRDYGDLYAELYPGVAPITVENFLKLVNEKFYDGLTFHRIISGFMIQGGDPLGNGTGGSSQQIKGEFSANGVENALKHGRGVLSMARSSDMNSASSQFFIMHAAATHLDGQYAAFGQVLSGLWIVDKICQSTPVQDSNGTVLKEDQPVIAEIREVTREEAQAAMALEAAQGKAGSLYEDPLSNLSFMVPDGWNQTLYQTGASVFTPDSDPQKIFILRRANQWDSLRAAYKEYFAQQGLTRKDMGTTAFKKDSLIGLVSQDAAPFTEETHSGVLFYTAELTDSSGQAYTCFVGAHDAYLYLLTFGGTRSDPLFADVLQVLDNLQFAD